MMEAVITIFLVLGAIALGAVLFCIWVVVLLVRWLVRLGSPKRPPVQEMQSMVQICANPQCQCGNPSHARFCRRCGKSLPSLLRVVSSRAAVL